MFKGGKWWCCWCGCIVAYSLGGSVFAAFLNVFSALLTHTHAKCVIYWESKMAKSDILIIFQTFVNVCKWLLPSYTSWRNGCVHANTHANSHQRYIHSSIFFQMSPSKTQNWRVRGVSGNPQDSIQLFLESPPVAAFSKDPDQLEKAKSC